MRAVSEVTTSRPRRARVTRRDANAGRAARPGWWDVLLREVDGPLASALAMLAQHSQTIEASWRSKLARLAFTPDELDALARLTVEAYSPQVRAGAWDRYALALERVGHDLARRGLPETEAMAALVAQLESALPYVVTGRPGELAAALVRLTFAGGLSLTAGYSRARATSWRRFGEQERQRLSRDLHDEIGHHLVVLKLYLGMITRELAKQKPKRLREKLDEATGLVNQAIQSVRRLILDLGPVALEGVGFLPALKLYARQFSARTGVKVHVRHRGLPPALAPGHETALYRLLQGALSNVLKHARARAVKVTVGSQDGAVIFMTVQDDGVGFDTTTPRQAFGLAAMRDRVASLGGRFRVDSRPAGPRGRHGTRLEVELPVAPGPPR
jgi:signal transduction histidine kinase